MKRFVHFIIQKWIPNYNDIHDLKVRSQYGSMEGWTSIVVNTLLFLLKGFFSLLTGSLSLLADAFHTLSDVSTSIIVLISFKISKKPADVSHPFGHGRMEAIATLIVAVLLLVIGFEIFKESIDRVVHPKPFGASWLVIIIIGVTVIIKELLAQFSRELGIRIKSDTLKADFWHHRTDAISSLLVLGAFIGQRFGLSRLDGLAGIGVAAMILYAGWEIARHGIDELLGQRPSDEMIVKIKNTVRLFPEVLGVHDLIIHHYGQAIIMSFHIVISEDRSLKSAHDLADRVTIRINDTFHTHTTVHLDPVNTKDPLRKKIDLFLENYLSSRLEKSSFHDLRTRGTKKKKQVLFDLSVDPQIPDNQVNTLKIELHKALLRAFPIVKDVFIEIEPKYVR
ncbi:cation diffusion facilitator family transporter [bacterium]